MFLLHLHAEQEIMGVMKKLIAAKPNEHGFIPLLLSILFIVVALIAVVYIRVAHAGH